MHTVVDVNPRASTERMLGDTDLRFCTYTCPELPHVPLCCHLAMYYNFLPKKSVTELNDQPLYAYTTLWVLSLVPQHGIHMEQTKNCIRAMALV